MQIVFFKDNINVLSRYFSGKKKNNKQIPNNPHLLQKKQQQKNVAQHVVGR